MDLQPGKSTIIREHRMAKASLHRTAALCGLFALNFLLRIPYIRYDFLNGDEGIRALTALRMLGGGGLYADVITDKPPGATLFYLIVLRIFPHSMPAVHVAAILWNFCTALVIYAVCRKMFSMRAALWAALLFVYFSTNYFTQDMIAANTELLMLLPYTLAVYFYVLARKEKDSIESAVKIRETLYLFLAGLMTGVACLFKQVGVFNLVFFLLAELLLAYALDRRNAKGSAAATQERRAKLPATARRLGLICVGYACTIAALIVWLKANGAIAGFWRNAVVLGALYIDALSMRLWMKYLVLRSLGYMLFNAALFLLAFIGMIRSAEGNNAHSKRTANQDGPSRGRISVDRWEVLISLWALVSFSGVFTGGRFFGHYFLQALPPMAILGARGVEALRVMLKSVRWRKTARGLAWAAILVFVFGLFRFHHKTAILVYEEIVRHQTHWSRSWEIDKRQRDAVAIADFLSQRVGKGAPLYIWGYQPEIYWQSGCVPASRYLTPYYITGHFYPEVKTNGASLEEPFWREARQQFVSDLEHSAPEVILNVDESVTTLQYPEIVEFFKENYKWAGLIGPEAKRRFVVYHLRKKSPLRRNDQKRAIESLRTL